MIEQLFPLALQMNIIFQKINETIVTVKPLMMTLFGLAAYAIFILEFYEFISTRDIFKEESSYRKARKSFRERAGVSKALDMFVTVLEYLLLFPFVVFFWAGVFFVIIVTVSSAPNVEMILLTSIAIVGAIRICAYYRRKIAEDVAKLLPLVLLGNFVLDLRVIDLGGTYNTIKNAFFNPEFQFLALYYFMFLILLEFVLRSITFLWRHRKIVKNQEEEFEETSTESKEVIAEEVEEE